MMTVKQFKKMTRLERIEYCRVVADTTRVEIQELANKYRILIHVPTGKQVRIPEKKPRGISLSGMDYLDYASCLLAEKVRTAD